MAKITIDKSVVKQATNGNKEAIKTMFQSFMSVDETIVSVEYLGSLGLFFTTKSFVCITTRK